MSTLGVRLKEARELLAKSQEAFALGAGVKKRAQINYEQDLRVPDANYLKALADSGVDVLYVLTGHRLAIDKRISRGEVSSRETVLGDRDRLAAAIDAVEEGLAETKRRLAPSKKAELILAAYDLMKEPAQSRDNVIRLVRMAA